MNDCKYGCDVMDNVMRLSLLRAPIRPDRESDRGEHYFTYSIFSHGASWQQDGLVEEAYDLNYPLWLVQGKKLKLPEDWSVAEISNPALKSQAFKQAEDGSGDIVLRLAELYGSHGEATIKPGFGFSKAYICDLLEEKQTDLLVYNGEINIKFRPYEIISIRLHR
jgi:alpha-mannosidase